MSPHEFSSDGGWPPVFRKVAGKESLLGVWGHSPDALVFWDFSDKKPGEGALETQGQKVTAGFAEPSRE